MTPSRTCRYHCPKCHKDTDEASGLDRVLCSYCGYIITHDLPLDLAKAAVRRAEEAGAKPALVWTRDGEYEVARIGAFEVTILSGGETTIGVTVWTATFAGRVCGIKATRDAAVASIFSAVRRECIRAGGIAMGQVQ